ncbi:hypothetical protein JOF53_006637 [Crossiella equi]|uniref:Lipoprotein n=1 Tax=Crossiella equi TaxID=130796 RepID=A0ABS5AMG3_9PSEU|nr:hypothetical protein [Crossiella equi]MBP2477765.1 hypothetical protein [Crossiella equi]
MRFIALLLAALALFTGCGSSKEGPGMHYDYELGTKLEALRAERQSKPFKDLVPGDWTSVHVIIGPHTEEWVAREVGTTLPDSSYGYDTEGNILVFLKASSVVQVKGTGARHLGEGHFSDDVVLTGTERGIKVDDPNPPQPR